MTTSVANKDESLKCVSIGRRALADGDLAKAERMATKAAKLYHCTEVAHLERAVASAAAQPGANGTPPNTSGHADSARHTETSQQDHADSGVRRRAAHGHAGAAARPADDAGTPQQRELVNNILKAQDFYQILAIDRSASDDDIKKAYRKLALKLHPDKCKAAHAEEAFKAVSKAFSCLSDSDKRAYYDRTGYENTAAAAAAASQQRNTARRGMRQGPAGMYYAEDFDADEIFNMFFGGGLHGQMFRAQYGTPRRQTQHHQRPANDHAASNRAMLGLMQVLPVLLLVLLSWFSGSGTPVFSVAPNQQFPVKMLTNRLKVPFFVSSEYDFERQYPIRSSQRAKLERQVESEYYDSLQQRCQNEQIQRQRMYYSFRQREMAKSMKLHACNDLDDLNKLLARVY